MIWGEDMLDFRIESFLMVCKTMNMTKAAQALHITQPAVSQHIKALEQEFGVPLFLHQGKKMRLTQAGEMLCQSAQTMRHDAAMLKQQMALAGRERRVLNFGATLTVGEYAMPPVLIRYLAQHPDTRISLHVADTTQLLQRLDSGAIDFAIVEGTFPQSIYECLLFRKERFLAVCSGQSTLKKQSYRIQELLSQRLLVREEGSGSRRILQTYLEGENLSIEDFVNRVEAGNIAVLKTLAQAGCGITFLYETAVKQELMEGTLQAVPLENFNIQHDFSFLWRKGSQFAQQYQEIYQALKEQA